MADAVPTTWQDERVLCEQPLAVASPTVVRFGVTDELAAFCVIVVARATPLSPLSGVTEPLTDGVKPRLEQPVGVKLLVSVTGVETL